jgi:hypothetical protein
MTNVFCVCVCVCVNIKLCNEQAVTTPNLCFAMFVIIHARARSLSHAHARTFPGRDRDALTPAGDATRDANRASGI